MRYLAVLLILGCLGCSEAEHDGGESAQVAPLVFEKGDRFGYRNASGEVVIEPRFVIAQAFAGEIAYVVDDGGWAVIDQQGDVILKPFIYDNGPDPFQDGLARFVAGDKVGYYDKNGMVQLAAVYDFAEPFRDGKARACVGCAKVMDGEHARYEGGTWFVIDTEGKTID